MRRYLCTRTGWTLGALLVLGVCAVVLWPSRAQLILTMATFEERKGPDGERNGQRMRDRLIACGPSAIGPTIAAIRAHGVWVRGRAAYLPSVLAGLGDPAHRAVLAAIDAEQDTNARGYLISALQRAFADYSRLDRWLADARTGTVSSFQMSPIGHDVRWGFPEAPELCADGRLSTRFAEWWRTNQHTKPRRLAGEGL